MYMDEIRLHRALVASALGVSLVACGTSALPASAWADAPAPVAASSAAQRDVLSASTRALAGATTRQPFISGQTAQSNHFRIPSIITLDNGWLLAAADARWNTYGDSPANLDSVVTLSKDGGRTWEWQVVNEFVDYESSNKGGNGQSASFIDPTLIQGGDGKVYMVADAFPADAGVWGLGGNECHSTGFNKDGDFLLAKKSAGDKADIDAAGYTYYADASAAQDFSVDGKTVSLRPIKDASDQLTGSWIDAYYDLYTVKDGVASPELVAQGGDTGKTIHNNVFYRQSQYKAYPTCYLWLVTGEVTDSGIEWGDPSIINVKRSDDQPFTGICPGRGLTVPLKDGGERIMFQIYESKQGGNEKASAIWSDDGGKTWERGGRAQDFNGSGKSSESQTIRLPNGGVRMYSRNGVGEISYTDSHDGGKTWSAYTLDPELDYVGNCMVSFINVEGELVDANGRVYGNLVAASYPRSSGRSDGVIRIGSIDALTNKVTWLNEGDIRYPGRYLYSCLTQTAGGELALVAERQTSGENIPVGSEDVMFTQFAITDLLGEGWSYTPALSLSTKSLGGKVGETRTVSASAIGMEGVEVTWSLVSDTGVEVATLSSSAGDSVEVSMVAPGRATLTATATGTAGGKGFTRTMSARVHVTPDGEIALPEEYENHELRSSVGYFVQDGAEIPDGTYLIHGSGKDGRILYGHTTDRTDVLMSGINNGMVAPDISGKFPTECQEWVITKTEQGYAIYNKGKKKYLSMDATTTGGLPYTDNAQTHFQIEKNASDGGYQISAQVGGVTYYIDQNDAGKFIPSKEKTKNKINLGLHESHYVVDMVGTRALIGDASDVTNADAFTADSWSTFQAELTRARELDQELAGGLDFPSEEQANAAIKRVDDQALALFSAMQGLTMRVDVDYTVTYKIVGDYFAIDNLGVQTLHWGDVIDPLEAPVHEGYTFSGWRGAPEDGRMPEGDLVLTGSFSKNTVTPEPAPLPEPKPGTEGSKPTGGLPQTGDASLLGAAALAMGSLATVGGGLAMRRMRATSSSRDDNRGHGKL